MRIAYLVSCYPTLSHTFILRELQAIRARGHQVTVFSVRRPANPEQLGSEEQRELPQTRFLLPGLWRTAPIACFVLLFSQPLALLRLLGEGLRLAIRLPRALGRMPFYLAEALVLLVSMRRTGIGHIHNHFGNAAGTVAQLAAASGLVTYSLSIHGPDIFHNVADENLAEKVERSLFTRTISHFCSSQLRLHGATEFWKKLSIVRCGVDTQRFQARASDRSDDARIRLLCVGRLTPAKGQLTLLHAMRQLRERGLSTHLTIVGDGPDKDELTQFVQAQGLASQVHLTGGLSQEGVLEAFRQADAFVLPSFAEGIPVVLMEAMAMGLPVLSTYVAGIPELIRDGENGLLVAPGDKEALGQKLEALIADASLRERLGQAARETVCAHYNLEANGRQMADLFEAQLAGGLCHA